jgi:rsbT co-antagonist protein RsbR
MNDDRPQPSADDALPLPEAALESMPFPMNIYRPDGLVIASNMGVERLFHQPRNLVVNIYNVYDDSTTEANGFRAAFERAGAGERVTVAPTHFDPAQQNIDGPPIWFSATLFPFTAADGRVASIGATYQDVTAQVQAESERERRTTERTQRVRELQPFFALVENAPDGFMLVGVDQRVTYANRAFKEMSRDDNIVGKPITDLVVVQTGKEFEEVGKSIAASGAWQGESVHRRPDGSTFPVYVSMFLVFDEDGKPNGSASVVRDLTAQHKAEEERAALQEQIIASQQAAIRELSTPLIPLAENIVVMPIVGAIDTRRAQQIMETLLEGIAAHQAEMVLLDISGVRVVDTQVADALLRAAKAVKLLGAQVVLTGISAEIAQTVVHLGADMGEIITQANLQAGLRYAIERYGGDLSLRETSNGRKV